MLNHARRNTDIREDTMGPVAVAVGVEGNGDLRSAGIGSRVFW